MEKYELKWVAWESTVKCNLDCIHCRSTAGAAGHEPAGTAKAKLLMDRVAEFARPVFVLSGGEPLLRKDIFELAEYGTKLGFRMAMATNGSLITGDTCRRMKGSGIKIVALSLDGSTAAVHDDFRRQKGCFEGTLRGIRHLKENNIEFIINSSFTKRNSRDIPNTYAMAKSLGAKAWYMFLVVPMGRGADILGEMIGREEYEDILRWHYGMESAEGSILVRPTCAPSYYRIYAEEEKKRGGRSGRRNLSYSPGGGKGCVAAQSIAYIGAGGDVYPCSYFTLSGGNIYKQKFAEIWGSELFRSFRGSLTGADRCGVCEYAGICGGCRARALIYEGDMLANDPYCAHAPSRRVRG